MQVKIFEAPDMATGLRMVRKELGPDALILSTRTVKDGKMGLLGKKYLEITAAVDNQWEEQKAPSASASPTPPSASTANKSTAAMAYQNNITDADAEQTTSQIEERLDSREIETKKQNLTFTMEPKSKDEDLQDEVTELKNIVKSLAGEVSRLNSTEPEVAQIPTNRILSKLEQRLRTRKSNSRIEEILLENGVNSETANLLSAFATENLDSEETQSDEELYGFLHETVADLLTVKNIDFLSESDQKRIALIGPTGVGKTTTLAKLAARFLTLRSKSIALITIDTYRIAAVEQLKVYGEIMHLPVEVVITPQELESALEKHQDKDLILIDTAGRSPLDNLSIDEISSFLKPEFEIENHLVLSATTRDEELLETLNRFSKIPITSTIFTKIDECLRLGVLLNVQAQNGSPVSFVTNGQRVPEDIVEIDNSYLAQLIIPSPGGAINE